MAVAMVTTLVGALNATETILTLSHIEQLHTSTSMLL